MTFQQLISDPCPAGQYRSADKTACEKCGENEISPGPGASSCTACRGGNVANGDKTKCGMFDIMIVSLDHIP